MGSVCNPQQRKIINRQYLFCSVQRRRFHLNSLSPFAHHPPRTLQRRMPRINPLRDAAHRQNPSAAASALDRDAVYGKQSAELHVHGFLIQENCDIVFGFPSRVLVVFQLGHVEAGRGYARRASSQISK